jgi:hypothetical protein
LGLGGEILDTPGEEDVTDSDGRDAGLVFAAQSQVNLPGSTDVGDKILGGGVGGDHLGCVTKGEGCAHSPRHKMRGGLKILGSPVNLEEKVPSHPDGELVFEDMELGVFLKNKTMGFGWVADDLSAFDTTQGAADNRVGVDFVGPEDSDGVAVGSNLQNGGPVRGLADDLVVSFEPIREPHGETRATAKRAKS